jgi:hypothetical protein
MGGGSSKAESAYKETQLSEFAAQYKNTDMPQLDFKLRGDGVGSVTTNTSDMPAVLDAIGNMCASLQVPLELKDKTPAVSGALGSSMKSKTLGPFRKQVFALKNYDRHDHPIYTVALSDALEPLGWKYNGDMTFTKVGGA